MNNNFNKSISTNLYNKKIALYSVNCNAVCGYCDGDDIYILDVFSISDFVTNYFTRNCTKICLSFFDKVVEELDLKEGCEVRVNGNERELFIKRSDGGFALLYDLSVLIKENDVLVSHSLKSENKESIV